MAFNRQRQRMGAHAVAIIFEAEGFAATAEADIYLCRARINVFHAFHRAGRTPTTYPLQCG